MATQKRRIVYFSDKEWADIQGWAKGRGTTASALIREAVFDDSYYAAPPLPPKPDLTEEGWLDAARKTLPRSDPFANDPRPGFRPTTQAERDAILRRVNKGG